MRKWLLLVVLFLLAASLAGDVLLVHHHLDGISLQAEHDAPLTVITIGVFLFGVCASVILTLGKRISGQFQASSLSHFCGWHSSAYDETTLLS